MFLGYLLLHQSRLLLNLDDLSPQLIQISEGLLYMPNHSIKLGVSLPTPSSYYLVTLLPHYMFWLYTAIIRCLLSC
jgi:hypothetical protein